MDFGNISATPSSSITLVQSSGSMKFAVVRDLWSYIPKSLHCPQSLRKAVNRFLAFLIRNERTLVPSDNPLSQSRQQWAQLCADVVIWGPPGLSKYFWTGPDGWDWGWTLEQRRTVWRWYASSWRRNLGPWEGATLILAFPLE